MSERSKAVRSDINNSRQDTEIGVFEAEKYFRTTPNELAKCLSRNSERPTKTHTRKHPTCSENSSVLFSSNTYSSSTSPKMGWRVACSCPCNTKKSIATTNSLLDRTTTTTRRTQRTSTSSNVDTCSNVSTGTRKPPPTPRPNNPPLFRRNDPRGFHVGHHPKTMVSNSNSTSTSTTAISVYDTKHGSFNVTKGFSFPALQSSSSEASSQEDKPRLSLQVFQSVSKPGSSGENSFQRRQRVYSLDMDVDTRSSFSFPRMSFCSQDSETALQFFTKGGGGGGLLERNCEEDKSDSSSDLFEIESISKAPKERVVHVQKPLRWSRGSSIDSCGDASKELGKVQKALVKCQITREEALSNDLHD